MAQLRTPGKFGKLCFRLVDGNPYAQPLYASGVTIIGRTGPQNAVIVATQNNSVFAFDADVRTRPPRRFSSGSLRNWGSPSPPRN